MANAFKNSFLKNATTSFSNVYVCPAATTATVIGMTIGNTGASPITTNVAVVSATVSYVMVQDATIAVGGALVPVGGDQKVVLESGDYLKVQVNTASSADVILSVLEIT